MKMKVNMFKPSTGHCVTAKVCSVCKIHQQLVVRVVPCITLSPRKSIDIVCSTLRTWGRLGGAPKSPRRREQRRFDFQRQETGDRLHRSKGHVASSQPSSAGPVDRCTAIHDPVHSKVTAALLGALMAASRPRRKRQRLSSQLISAASVPQEAQSLAGGGATFQLSPRRSSNAVPPNSCYW